MGNYIQNNTFSIVDDTIINTISYFLIYQTNDSIFDSLNSKYFCAVREESNKWYFIKNNDTHEYMLYDFNVLVGDTVSVYNPWTEIEKELIVFEKDSIQLLDKYHKTFNLGRYDPPSGEPFVIDKWIEGIGSIKGLRYSGYFVFDHGYQLLCFHSQNSLIYLNSPDNSCGFIKVGTSKIKNKTISVFPNPFNEVLLVETDNEFLAEIFSLTGEKLTSSNNKSISVAYLPPGLYILKIHVKSNGLIITKKIVKH